MSGIVIRPGDTVLMRVDQELSADELTALAEKMKDRLPGCDIIFLSGLQVVDVYRPDGGADE